MLQSFSPLMLSALLIVATGCYVDLDGNSRGQGPRAGDGGMVRPGPSADASARPSRDGSVAGSADGAVATGGDVDSGHTDAHDGSPALDAGDSGSCIGDSSVGNCGFSVRRKITFDATTLLLPLDDFPVLVTLDPTRIDYAKTRAGGADVRFVDDDGVTLLAHEIERWEEAGTSSIWVKIPHIAPTSLRHIYMVYGSASAAATSDGKQVFSADYEAVYHLSDDLVDHRVRDACGAHDGTTAASMGASDSVPGRVGHAIALDGIDHLARLGSLDTSGWTALTLEAWVFQHANSDARVMCQSSGTAVQDHILCLGISDKKLRVRISTSGEEGDTHSYDADGVVNDEWMHLAVTWDAQSHTVNVYRNALPVGSFDHKGKAISESSLPMILGNINLTDPGFLVGTLDEVRISPVVRSLTWLAAEVSSAGDSRVSYGPEETL